MGQYPPPGQRRPYGDGDGEGDEDDALRRPPYGDQGRGGPGGGDRQFTYYQEERYWTDYLRIAAPVVGVILLLALAWFWINNLIGGDDAASTPTATSPAGVNIVTGASPTARTGLGTPLSIATNPPSGSPAGTPRPTTAAGKFKSGDKVVIANTGGSGANMRSQATTGGQIVATLAEGTALTVTGEPIRADGYTWWPVQGTDGSGFVVEDFLKAQ